MLFIQAVTFVYTKAVRNAPAANVRRAVKFLPVEFDKADITDEILFNRAELFQTPDGLKNQRNKTYILGDDAFFVGKFAKEYFGDRVYVLRSENGYEVLYTDKKERGYVKSKFTLSNGQSGRIVYNERYSNWDCPWLYFLTTFTFVCADKAAFRRKIFYIKEPDFTFKDMKQLRYNGF